MLLVFPLRLTNCYTYELDDAEENEVHIEGDSGVGKSSIECCPTSLGVPSQGEVMHFSLSMQVLSR